MKPRRIGHRRATALLALLAFILTTFGPTVALALARATTDAPITVELCSTSGIKRVLLDAASADVPAPPQSDARPAPADCKYCKLLSVSLAPPPGAVGFQLLAGDDPIPPRNTLARLPSSLTWRGASPRAPPRS
ncbi:MAG: DUF2946 family protein [Casimicrobiaceae bacterium]